MKTKGMAIDISGPEINSLEDSDRLDKATSAGRPWFDPSVKMHVCKLFIMFLQKKLSLI